MDQKGQDELYEGKIFSFSPVLFFIPSVSLSAISRLSKFMGALPQGEMKALGCIW